MNKPQYYTLEFVQEIDGFDKDAYGNTWYNAKFEDDAETYMWLKKDAPIEGQKYYGHTEPTKSGKRLRFKTDKLPDDAPRPSKTAPKPDKFLKDTSDLPYRVWKDLLPFMDVPHLIKSPEYNRQLNEYVMKQADELLGYIENVREEETGYDKFQAAKKQFDEPMPTEEDMPHEL